MAKKIKNISVHYEDGTTELLNQEIVSRLNNAAKNYVTLTSLLSAMLQEKEASYKLEKLSTEHKEEINQIIERSKEDHKNGLKQQSYKISGEVLQRFCPFGASYPYDVRDAHPVFLSFDWIVLKGESNNEVSEVVFQEMKTGDGEYCHNIDTYLYKGKDYRKRISLRDTILRRNVRWETWYGDRLTGQWQLVPSPTRR